MLLEFERCRREGGRTPSVEVEAGREIDPAFAAAMRRYLPWVQLTQQGAGGASHGGRPAPATMLSAQELAMLFEPHDGDEGGEHRA